LFDREPYCKFVGFVWQRALLQACWGFVWQSIIVSMLKTVWQSIATCWRLFNRALLQACWGTLWQSLLASLLRIFLTKHYCKLVDDLLDKSLHVCWAFVWQLLEDCLTEPYYKLVEDLFDKALQICSGLFDKASLQACWGFVWQIIPSLFRICLTKHCCKLVEDCLTKHYCKLVKHCESTQKENNIQKTLIVEADCMPLSFAEQVID